MFSGLSRHSGMRVKPDLSTALTMSSAGSSALTVIISVRWTMTSDTVRSRRSSNPPIMSRSSFSTLPSRCKRSTVPRISSCGARIDCSSPIRTPRRRRSWRTSHSIAISTGPSTRTTNAIGRAAASAMRSGALKAIVFGSTSANTTTSTVINAVA